MPHDDAIANFKNNYLEIALAIVCVPLPIANQSDSEVPIVLVMLAAQLSLLAKNSSNLLTKQ